MHDNNKITIIN